MYITNRNQPYAVVVQQTPDQWHAEGNAHFPEKYVIGYFDDYDTALECFNETIDAVDDLVRDYTEGFVSLYSYSSTAGDTYFTHARFYSDGTVEDRGIMTATEYGMF